MKLFCTVCQDTEEDANHFLSCGHQYHFGCIFDMVFKGKIFRCPNCRNDFVQDWLNGYEIFILNHAREIGEEDSIRTEIQRIRNNPGQGLITPPDSPPPLIPNDDNPPPLLAAQEFGHLFDAGGNLVVQVGPDIDIRDLLLEDDMMREPVVAPPEERPAPGPVRGALIPNRRGRRRNRPYERNLIPNRREAAERIRMNRIDVPQRALQIDNDGSRDGDDEATDGSG